MTFWDHLEELRRRLWYVLLAAVAAAVACFCLKEPLFSIILAPRPEGMRFINTDLTQQLLTHMRVACWVGLLTIAPYIIYQLFAFVAPGLYRAERRAAAVAVAGAYLLFMAGVALNYFVVFPFTVQFLYAYRVSPDVENAITLTNYVSILGMMSLVLGVVFELPVLCWLLARLGVLRAAFMRRYRRHAVVAILIVGAVITPTGDPFTLLVVSLPVYLLWELSILVVRRTERRPAAAGS